MKHLIWIFLFVFATPAFGQNVKQADQLEELFDEDSKQQEKVDRQRAKRKSKKAEKLKRIKKVTDLKRLETFDDIAVIQRRFLPKTGRFEFAILGATNINDAFFVGNGVNARFGYYFRERWALEASYFFFSNKNRELTNDLLVRGVDTQGQVSTDTFYGVELKWTPIYGKYAQFTEKIVPFDMYFGVGVGITKPQIGKPETTTSQQQFDPSKVGEPMTLKLSTGQILAITKWMAFRWELSWHMFNAQSPLAPFEESLQTNMFLNMGISLFFPEAKYR